MATLYKTIYDYVLHQMNEQNICDKSAFNTKLNYRTYLGWYWEDAGDIQPSMGASDESEIGRGILLLLSGCSVPRNVATKENRLVLVPAEQIGVGFRARAEKYIQSEDLAYIKDIGYSELGHCRVCAIPSSFISDIGYNTDECSSEQMTIMSSKTECEPSLFTEIDFYSMKNFVVIDMEKLGDSQLSVCEVGMVKYIDGIKNSEFHSYIKPSNLSRNLFGQTKLKHITDDILINAPEFSTVYADMKTFVDGLTLICHNKGADLNYIYYNEKEYNLSGLYKSYIDTREIVHTKLEEAYSTLFGRMMPDHHHALNDARHTAEVFVELMKRIDVTKYIEIDYIPEKEKPKKDMSIFQAVGIDGLDIEDHLLNGFTFEGKVCVVSGESPYRHQIEAKLTEICGRNLPTKVAPSTNVLIVSDKVGNKKKEQARIEKVKRPDSFHIFSQEAVARILGIIE